MTRNYTGNGDDGTTTLFDGTRVSKSDARIAAIGALDTLNSFVGLARSLVRAEGPKLTQMGTLEEILIRVQDRLHQALADIATPENKKTKVERIGPQHTKEMEEIIDAIDAAAGLPNLTKFIIPGETPCGAALHVARAWARAAESAVVNARETGAINPHLIPYLNRLSSLLFVLARWENYDAGQEEKHPQYDI